MLTLGVDPDLHFPSLAIVHASGRDFKTLWLAAPKIPRHLTGKNAVRAVTRAVRNLVLPSDRIDRIAIEGQKIYVDKNVDPGDILNLALTAGVIAGILSLRYPEAETSIPEPAEWKGQVDKRVFAKRVCGWLDMGFVEGSGRSKTTWIVPKWPADVVGLDDVEPAAHKHLIDAAGLAVWAAKSPQVIFK